MSTRQDNQDAPLFYLLSDPSQLWNQKDTDVGPLKGDLILGRPCGNSA